MKFLNPFMLKTPSQDRDFFQDHGPVLGGLFSLSLQKKHLKKIRVPPKFVHLEAFLQPVLRENNISVEFIRGVSLGVMPLIKTAGNSNHPSLQRGIVESVGLHYSGKGAVFDEESGKFLPFYGLQHHNWILKTETLLYEKRFRMPSRQHYQLDYKEERNVIITIPGGKECWPYFALGGFYTPESRLEEIAPLFFTVNVDQDISSAHIKPLQYFRESKMAPPEGGIWVTPRDARIRIVFVEDLSQNECTTLSEDIARDSIQIELWDDAEKRSVFYKSRGFDYLHGVKNRVKIEFEEVSSQSTKSS